MGLLDKAKPAGNKAIAAGGKVADKKTVPQASTISTLADRILGLLGTEGSTLKQLSGELFITPDVVEEWVKILQKKGLVEISYPANMMASPVVKITHQAGRMKRKALSIDPAAHVINSYTIEADYVPALIRIWDSKTENVPIYEIEMPHIGAGTTAILDYFVEKLTEIISVDMDDITDPKRLLSLKKKFFSEADSYVKKHIQGLDEEKRRIVAGMILHRMYGLGELDVLLSDNFLEELTVNGAQEPISIYHKKHGWCKTTIFLMNEEEIYNFSAQIGRKIGREITSLAPIMDAHLLTGDRVASTLFPISSRGNTITIRRFARNPWTPISLIEAGTMSKEIAALLWLAMQYELNILVAGGTASGKTSTLNSICSFIPPNQRVLTIEDTREIFLPQDLHWNWVPLTSRNANPEGEGEVTMLDLMVAALRMRPDRIVVGEVRRREQAEAMFEAMHTGHSVYATIHADTAQQVKRRLIEPPIAIPQTEVEALHLVLMQFRDRRRGVRRTLELAEVVGGEKELTMNYLYRWRPRNDTFEKVNESTKIMEDLNLHTGMTVKEIQDDLRMKEKILDWMVKQGIKDMDEVGRVMKLYYKNPETIIKACQSNAKKESILH